MDVNSRFRFAFHKAVIYSEPTCGNKIGEIPLNQKLMLRSRGELEEKIAAAFYDEIKELSTELQEILIDDLVTAFENRLKVLNRSSMGRRF